jgi:hypothetical protein
MHAEGLRSQGSHRLLQFDMQAEASPRPHIQDLGGVYLRHVLMALAITQRAWQHAAG